MYHMKIRRELNFKIVSSITFPTGEHEKHIVQKRFDEQGREQWTDFEEIFSLN
mgnify:FL=1